MEQENSKSGKKSAFKSEASGLEVIFIIILSIIFFLRAGVYVFTGVSILVTSDELKEVLIGLLPINLALLYGVIIIGFIGRRHFAYTLAWLLLGLEVLLLPLYLSAPSYMVPGIFGVILTLLLLLGSKKYFKPHQKIDNLMIKLVLLLVLVHIAALLYSLNLPKPEPYYQTITREAIQKSDIKICDKIKNGYKYDCILSFAETNQNSSICELINSIDVRNRCYLHIAEATNNSSLCELIKNDYERGMCNAETKQ